MAIIGITQFNAFEKDGRGNILPLAVEPHIGHQALTFGASTAATALGTKATIVRLLSDSDCHIAFSGSAALVSDEKFIAGVEYWRRVSPGVVIYVYDGTT